MKRQRLLQQERVKKKETERKRAAPVTAMQLRRWSSRQVTNRHTRGSAGTPASVARLQQLQVQQIFAGKNQEQRQPELQGPQPAPGDPLCRNRLPAKTSFCQGVGTVRAVGGWGSRTVAVGTTLVAPRSWGSEGWVSIPRAPSSGNTDAGRAGLSGSAGFGGCWGPGLLSKHRDPAWVCEKGGLGGGTAQSLQHQGC